MVAITTKTLRDHALSVGLAGRGAEGPGGGQTVVSYVGYAGPTLAMAKSAPPTGP